MSTLIAPSPTAEVTTVDPTLTPSPLPSATDQTSAPTDEPTTASPTPSAPATATTAGEDATDQAPSEGTDAPSTPSTTDGSELPTTPGGTTTTIVWEQRPAVETSQVSGLAFGVAVAALLVVAVVLALLRRRELAQEGTAGRATGVPAPASPEAAPGTPADPATAVTAVLAGDALAAAPTGAATPATTPPAHDPASEVAFLVLLGEALIDCASPIAEVQRVLVDVAEVHGFPEAEIIALPTAVLVTLPGTSAQTAAATAGGRSFRLDQVEDVVTLAEAARTGEIGTAEATARLRMIGLAPAPYSEPVLVAGYAVYSVGLSLILGGGWLDLLVVAGLGVLVALVRRLTSGRQTYLEALVVLGCAFGVSVVSLGLARLDVGITVLPTLVPPIVMFLPGALLTTGVIDLATRQMIAGAARLAAGAMQTVLLAVGVAAAASLVGVRASVLAEESHGVGVLGPWLGVVLFTAGVGLYHCVRRSALPWVLLVVTVAYAGQVVGGLLFGGVVSALVGAMAMTPVALYAASVRGGPPALVSFLPGFWVLVPGALALVGLTETFTTSTGGATSLLTAGATMVAVSLGVLVGLALHALGVAGADRLRRPTA